MQTTKHGKQQLSLLQPSSLSNEWRAGVELGLVLYGLRAGCEWCEEDVCWVGIFWVVVFRHVLAPSWYTTMRLKIVYLLNSCFVFIYAVYHRHYRRPLRGFPPCNVIVVKVIPEKTSLRAVCTNDHNRSQLSTTGTKLGIWLCRASR